MTIQVNDKVILIPVNGKYVAVPIGGGTGVPINDTSNRGLFLSGTNSLLVPIFQSRIDYISISTTGNATDFGDLPYGGFTGIGTCSSSTRGMAFGGKGYDYSDDEINQYAFCIYYASSGSFMNWGYVGWGGGYQGCSCSNNIIGLLFSGHLSNTFDPNPNNLPDTSFMTITVISLTSGVGVYNFGSLYISHWHGAASCASPTRGLIAGGKDRFHSWITTIAYNTFATQGNSINFGDLTKARFTLASCSNSTKGIFGGGINSISGLETTIDYVTIATTGNATDFGDLTAARDGVAACSNNTRGVFGGGNTGSISNTLDYITIATAGNATDFGDLTIARRDLGGCSNAHGGLTS